MSGAARSLALSLSLSAAPLTEKMGTGPKMSTDVLPPSTLMDSDGGGSVAKHGKTRIRRAKSMSESKVHTAGRGEGHRRTCRVAGERG